MQSHGNLILRLYGQARGQAADFLGEDYLGSDRWVQTMGIPNRANAWYESQNPIFGNYLDAFVGGINAYAKEHPEALTEELKVALPLKPADVLAQAQRVINFTFIVDPDRVENLAENPTPKGSNAWGSLLPILKAAMPCYWQILTFLGRIYFYGTKHN
jgi:acyl-homoserine-lactone acylase